jgi:hypothetical protein
MRYDPEEQTEDSSNSSQAESTSHEDSRVEEILQDDECPEDVKDTYLEGQKEGELDD